MAHSVTSTAHLWPFLAHSRGLNHLYETLKGAANGVTLPHLLQLGAAACVGLGVPKIKAAKLFKQAHPPPLHLCTPSLRPANSRSNCVGCACKTCAH